MWIAPVVFFLAAPQSEPDYKIDASLRVRKNNLECDGTTRLPDGAVLAAYLYYDRIREGRPLYYESATVKEGKFHVRFPVFQDPPLSGKYIAHLLFVPYLQQTAIQKRLGQHLRRYEARPELVLGTPAEKEKDRRRIYARLGAEIEGMGRVADEIRAELKKKQTEKTWAKKVAEWREAVRATVKRTYNVPEYRALDLGDIAEDQIDHMSQVLHRLIFVAGAQAANPGHPEPPAQVAKYHALFLTLRHSSLRRLGLAKATPEELKRTLGLVRSLTVAASELPHWLRTNPKATIVVYRARHKEFTGKLAEFLSALRRDVSPHLLAEIQRVEGGARAIFALVADPRKAKEDEIQRKMDEFLRDVDRLQLQLGK